MENNIRIGRQGKYPWKLWTNGETHRLTRGVDYDTNGFRNYLHQQALARGLKVTTTAWSDPATRKDGLTIQFRSKWDDEPEGTEPQAEPWVAPQLSDDEVEAEMARLKRQYGGPSDH